MAHTNQYKYAYIGILAVTRDHHDSDRIGSRLADDYSQPLEYEDSLPVPVQAD